MVRLQVLALLADGPSADMLPRALEGDELTMTGELERGLELALAQPVDVAFVDVTLGDGAGLAMVHHLKTHAPDCSIIAVAPPEKVDVAAHAISLGGTGVLVLPLEGDDVRNAVDAVRTQRIERKTRLDLERAAQKQARLAEWIRQLSDQSELTLGRVGEQLATALSEALPATGVAVYWIGVRVGSSPMVTALAAIGDLEGVPAATTMREVLAYAAEHDLVHLPLATPAGEVGMVLASASAKRIAPNDDALYVLLTHGAVSLRLASEIERASDGAVMKDPSSSAYSFAYYVDVAGREIDMAKRHGRRFAIAAVITEEAGETDKASEASAATVADRLLDAARETSVVARVDENEFQVLIPEAGGMDAQSVRRRMWSRLDGGTAVGVATFPHDGVDLGKLLRAARLRAERSLDSVARSEALRVLAPEDLLDALRGHAPHFSDLTEIRLTMPEAMALVGMALNHARRAGAFLAVAAQRAELGLAASVRSTLPHEVDNGHVHLVSLEDATGPSGGIEGIAIFAEHANYGLMGTQRGGELHAIHTDDPLVVDAIAESLGRAGGIRVFG